MTTYAPLNLWLLDLVSKHRGEVEQRPTSVIAHFPASEDMDAFILELAQHTPQKLADAVPAPVKKIAKPKTAKLKLVKPKVLPAPKKAPAKRAKSDL